MGDTLNGHLLFFHGFQQRSLRLGWGTVDFVRKENVGEQRAGSEFELAGFLVVHVRSHEV